MSDRVYLDWNASAPLRREARDAMTAAMELSGNPSSVHQEGRTIKGLVASARTQIADVVGCAPTQIVFTAGATEAAMVLHELPEGTCVFVQDTAHDCLWAHFDMTRVAQAPKGPGHILAMGLANGETGAITPVPARVEGQFAYGARAADSLLLDITQAVGRLAFDFDKSGADLAILSAHKLGGPKGVGALILRADMDISPLSVGGGQELGRRAGTENVIGIAGFAAAASAAQRDLQNGAWDEVQDRRDNLEAKLSAAAPDTTIVDADHARLPNTSCIITPGWSGQTQVMQMDMAGFAVSAGAACSSGKVKPSRVLQARGYDENQAASAMRVSIGPTTTQNDLDDFTAAWISAYQRHRARAA